VERKRQARSPKHRVGLVFSRWQSLRLIDVREASIRTEREDGCELKLKSDAWIVLEANLVAREAHAGVEVKPQPADTSEHRLKTDTADNAEQMPKRSAGHLRQKDPVVHTQLKRKPVNWPNKHSPSALEVKLIEP
jgi:hypothetical protein